MLAVALLKKSRSYVRSENTANTVTRRRMNKPNYTQAPTKRAIQQTVETADDCSKQCGADDAKPNHTTMTPHSKYRAVL